METVTNKFFQIRLAGFFIINFDELLTTSFKAINLPFSPSADVFFFRGNLNFSSEVPENTFSYTAAR